MTEAKLELLGHDFFNWLVTVKKKLYVNKFRMLIKTCVTKIFETRFWMAVFDKWFLENIKML